MGAKAAVTVALAALLTGCAAGGGTEYMVTQYGEGPSSAEVDVGTVDQPQKMRIWRHPNENKILVRTSAAEEAGLVLMQTAIWGPSYSGRPLPVFEKAATQYFIQAGQPNCKVSTPTRLTDSAYEFRYECVNAVPPIQRRR